MTDRLLHAVQLLSVACVVLLAGSIVSALLYPFFRRAIERCPPGLRSFVGLLYGLMAPALAIVVTSLAMLPEYAQVLVPSHCHDGACTSHIPVFSASSIGGMSLVAIGCLLLFGATMACLRGVVASQRRLQMLIAFGHREPNQRYLVVDCAERLAWCCGILYPKIFLSRGLIECLSPQQLNVVIGHEQAHARRLDNLRAVAVSWATFFWPGPLKRQIRIQLAMDCEQACDAEALRSLDDIPLFVSVIETLNHGETGIAQRRAAAFACNHTTVRIEAVVRGGSSRSQSVAAILMLCAIWFLQIAGITGITHRVVEIVAALG